MFCRSQRVCYFCFALRGVEQMRHAAFEIGRIHHAIRRVAAPPRDVVRATTCGNDISQ